jgi:hypothetical protein
VKVAYEPLSDPESNVPPDFLSNSTDIHLKNDDVEKPFKKAKLI